MDSVGWIKQEHRRQRELERNIRHQLTERRSSCSRFIASGRRILSPLPFLSTQFLADHNNIKLERRPSTVWSRTPSLLDCVTKCSDEWSSFGQCDGIVRDGWQHRWGREGIGHLWAESESRSLEL
ncbi:hypothetical protein BLNAU_16389 [Blattamonas nauphoetae]|uniref:Uncharacterized protein n=1 Tax=Blattamonas nauphoetae TaxID=2049346 RepID=A0ABQ9XBL2_9EUKA|nr:hypothetical protein BLNAU_16389 [Blattamonas nauphoetae]